MNIQDEKRFAEIMAALAEIFDNGKEPTTMKISLYYTALEGFTIEQITEAVKMMVRERVYPSFPKPGEIIEVIQGSQNDRAALAWTQVVDALISVGPYLSVEFKDHVIHSTINAMGGWIELGKVTNDELKWKQKEFESFYTIFSRKQDHPEYLPGSLEIENSARNFSQHIPERVKIGFGDDAKIARKALTRPPDQKQVVPK